MGGGFVMEIFIEQNLDNHLFEEVAFYQGMLGEFSYDPRQFCITFASIKGKNTDVLRYIGGEDIIHIPAGVIAVPYLLKEGYDDFEHITIVNHSRSLIDIDYMLYKTMVKSVKLEGFNSLTSIQTAESAFEASELEAIDIDSMSLSKCKNMVKMFADTKITSLDMTNVYLGVDANIDYLCADCRELQSVKLFNNGAGTKLALHMVEPFSGCDELKDLQIYDADDFNIESYNGDIRQIIPEKSMLFYNLKAFVDGFVTEFDEKLGVQLNECFDIKCINEYSVLIRNSSPGIMLNNVAFVLRMLQELKMDACGTGNEVKGIHFVRNNAKEIEQRNSEEQDKVIYVQSRQAGDDRISVYALYFEKSIKGYRIRYDSQYYDVSPIEYTQLGLSGIIPSKKLKLTCENEQFFVRQRYGDEVQIYGYDELVEVLELEKK